MALPTPPPYSNSIPNNPFYSPEAYITKGAYYPLTVGSGLQVDPVTALLTSTGGGGGGVTSLSAGPGIYVSAATGSVQITNTGVLGLTAGSGISLTSVGGVYTINNTGGAGTVITINTGVGLTGGPISTPGTISIANTGVSADTYINPTITVNAQGQITSASNGTALQTLTATSPLSITPGVNPVISVANATTLTCGVVTLSDSVTSAVSTTAATSCAVKCAYDIAVAAIPKACVTGKGALITGTAASTPVALTVGSDGQVLTACAACTEGLYWSTFSPASAATPTVLGTVFGCTQTTAASNTSFGYNSQPGGTNQSVAIGYGAGKVDAGNFNVWVGYAAGCTHVSGNGNTTLGWGTTCGISVGWDNTAIGGAALYGALAGAAAICKNVAVGTNTLYRATGCCNVAIGWQAGCSTLTGDNNVAIGTNISVPDNTGSGQLAIGRGLGSCWLTGCSDLAIKPGAGIIDCTNSCGTANCVLTSQGNAIQWKPVSSGIAAPNYGSFINTGTQIIGTVNVPQAVTLNTTVAANGFSLNGLGTQIIAANAGTYNLQFSIQLVVTTGGGGNVEIWLAKNGNAVPNSNTRFAVKNVNEAEFAALNYVETLAAGENLQLIWVTDDVHIQLFSYAAGANFAGAPAIPSAIVTIVPVGA